MKVVDGKILFVGPKRRYHAAHSGYEGLVRFLDGEVTSPPSGGVIERGTEAAARIVPAASRARWLRSWVGARWYGRRRFLEELAAAPTLLWGRRHVVHHLYGEESFRFGGYVPRLRGSRLVATFHIPPSRFAEYVARPALLGRLDAVIAVSRCQLELLGRWTRPGRVFFVPLGVDVDFFTPASAPPEELRCLFVGYFLRDFETLERVIEALAPHRVPLDLVLTPGKARRFAGRPGVTVHSGLSDEALREVYRRAGALVLPLLDSTSNNAFVEAMACGVPAIANDVGGVRDYCAPEHSIVLPDRDPAAFVEAILALRDDPARRAAMGRHARERAEREFDWRIVAASVRDVYRRALDG